MWIKVFRDRGCDLSYTVLYKPDIDRPHNSKYTIENKNHKIVSVREDALFYAIEKLFKDRLNDVG